MNNEKHLRDVIAKLQKELECYKKLVNDTHKMIKEFKVELEENTDKSKQSLMPRCSTCKHWLFNLKGYTNEYRMCNIADEYKSSGMIDAICSSEGIKGEFITRYDFGCVLHNEG